jgi:hypothetical protein
MNASKSLARLKQHRQKQETNLAQDAFQILHNDGYVAQPAPVARPYLEHLNRQATRWASSGASAAVSGAIFPISITVERCGPCAVRVYSGIRSRLFESKTVMARATREQLSAIRQRQRAHAKLRFSQRFELDLNRDRIHEIEQLIGDGHVFGIRTKNGNATFLVAVEGRLVAVAYDYRTQRVVTALPDNHVQELPPEMLVRARLRLLPSERERLVADILEGRALPLHRKGETEFYEIQYEGRSARIGYHRKWNRFVRFRENEPECLDKPSFAVVFDPRPPEPVPEALEVEPATGDAFRMQILDKQSTLLWQKSKTVTFHQVEHGDLRIRVGYSRSRDVFLQYLDPPKSMAELRSSIELLDGPTEIREAVTELARAGNAELLSVRNTDRSSYRVEYAGKLYYFDYSVAMDKVLPWFELRARADNY